MHAGASFGDDARFAHAQSQHDLAQHIVNLVRTGMVQIFPLEVNLCAAAMLGKTLCEVERRRTSNIGREMVVHLFLEAGIDLGFRVRLFELENEGNERRGDNTAAIDAELPALIGTSPERVWLLHGHSGRLYLTDRTTEDSPSWRGVEKSSASATRAARINARILSGSFSPGPRSTPDDTSTPGARVIRRASDTLSASRPPDSMKGTGALISFRSVQSNGLPSPPGRVASLGARASKIRRSTN